MLSIFVQSPDTIVQFVPGLVTVAFVILPLFPGPTVPSPSFPLVHRIFDDPPVALVSVSVSVKPTSLTFSVRETSTDSHFPALPAAAVVHCSVVYLVGATFSVPYAHPNHNGAAEAALASAMLSMSIDTRQSPAILMDFMLVRLLSFVDDYDFG
jgi:hypothetical protein